MAVVNDVLGSATPNAGRTTWNTNINAVNAESTASAATLAAVSGTIVGTTGSQILTNKTLVSDNRGGTNTMSISRKDLESSALFTVVSDSGTVTNIDVSGGSIYNLQVQGGNGLTTSVTANVLYVKAEAACVLNEASQTLAVTVSGVTAGYVAEFGGNVKVNNYLGVGSELAGVAGTTLHVKDANPTVRIEGTGTTATLSFYKSSADIFKISTNLSSASTFMSFGAVNVITLSSTSVTLVKDVHMEGSTNLVDGDMDVTGTLTAGNLVAVATDVVINSGPITISGGASSWNELVPYNQLVTMSPGQIIVGAPVSGVPEAATLHSSGDIESSTSVAGKFDIKAGVVSLNHMPKSLSAGIYGSNGTDSVKFECNSAGDITWTNTSTQLQFDIDSGVIEDVHIKEGADIQINKTALSIGVNGLLLNDNALELDPTVPSDVLFRSPPIGTVIAYAGDAAVEAGQTVDEVVTGWLHCNGATISIGVYEALYNALGDAWGAAGALPDLRGAFMRGVDVDRGMDPEYADRTGGGGTSVKVGSYQDDAFKSHTHTVDDKYHAYNSNDAQGGGADPNIKPVNKAMTTIEETTDATGNTYETRSKNYAVIYLIKY